MKIVYYFLLLFLLVSQSILAQATLLSEDFENPNFPSDWSQNTNANDGGWILGINTALESEYWSIATHGNFIATNDDKCDCDKSMDYLILPSLDFSASTVVALQFQNYFDGGSLFGGTEVATIEYSLNNGSSWTILEEIEGTDDGNWDSQTIDLSSLAGNENVLLAFRYFDDDNWLFGWAIDDVLVYEAEGLDLALSAVQVPSVINAPSNVSIVGTVTNNGLEEINSFDLSWDVGGMNYNAIFSGLSIPALGVYSFSHPDELEVTMSGNFELNVAISNINGMSNDLIDANNYWTQDIQAVEYGEILEDGFNREYIYYHPSTAPEECPLIFVFHGYTGTAQGIMEYSEFNQLADEFGFAVCYPQGIEDSFGNTFFNVGYDFQNGETVDDVAFIQNLNDHLHAEYSLNSQNIFGTGLSNGGDFCYLLACQASEQFKAVAPVAGMILQDIMDDCTPANEVSIFEIHGTADNVTYYDGDPNNIDNWGAYPSIPDNINFWTTLFGLDVLEAEDLPDINPNDGSTVSSYKYSQDDNCTEVWLYTVEEGGHDWPGAFGNMDISASREIWNFFDELCDVSVGIETPFQVTDRKLLKIVDILGRESAEIKNKVLFYVYSDGTTEGKIIFE
ncbi:MAG: polyhydroxybutyrate depolymerase [Saprospiraceae bacterium]|jgi:polyhydroxybutyrate depolymerase